ncbi:hypothetical protein [Qipengyuania profunda]|uniref:hypothetical protein n=1 Tax=Qipengyuania profunda TaxID=3113984 RepID=UPI002A189BB0|nr:hypothetical protein [Qipengyuania sp. HL-TH1]WPL56630.1 hypothetical protein SD421_14450 [Qipengyuania sp. HL-TH5]
MPIDFEPFEWAARLVHLVGMQMHFEHRIGLGPIGPRIVAHHAKRAPCQRQLLQLLDGRQAFDQHVAPGIAGRRIADELGFCATDMDAVGTLVDAGKGIEPDRERRPDRNADQQDQRDHRRDDSPFGDGIFQTFGVIDRHAGNSFKAGCRILEWGWRTHCTAPMVETNC